MFLDCPPSISLVSESVFEAADVLLVPMIPATLSSRTIGAARRGRGRRARRGAEVLAFFSMVDGRKNLHREVMEPLRAERDDVLDAAIPASVEVERMGASATRSPSSRPAAARRRPTRRCGGSCARGLRPSALPRASDDDFDQAPTRPTASYQADPEDVHRVLLLYSGGLDTSVMLKWIQEQYEAEVVALTVNLGQPGEDYEVIRGKALQLGALECHVVDAREEFAAEYVLPAIKANAIYGGGYPLFTALGRPLIAKLAVEHARETGCDTIAHGCTGKGNDQVRIEATIATLAPELKVIAPVRELADGPRGGGRLRARARDPGQGRNRGRALLDRRQPVGALERGPLDRGARPRARRRRVPARHAARGGPRRGRGREVGFERGVPVSLNGERLGLVELIERAAEIGARHGVGIVDQLEDRIVGLKVRDIYEVPAAAILLPAHQELERLVGTIHQNQLKPALDQKWAYLVYAGLWLEPLRTDLDAYMDAANAQVTGTIGVKLYKGSARVVTRSSPNAVYDAQLADVQRVRRAVLARCLARASSSCGRCSRGWPGGLDTTTAGSVMAWDTKFSDTRSGRASSGTSAVRPPASPVSRRPGHSRSPAPLAARLIAGAAIAQKQISGD